MKNPIKIMKSFFLEPFYYYYNILKSANSLRLEDLDDDLKSVIVNNYFENLYCVELAGAGENIEYFPQSLIDSLISDFGNDDAGEITWVLLKDGILKKNLIFTQNKKIALTINQNVTSKMLDFEEIANLLLGLYFSNEYDINYDKKELIQKYRLYIEDEFKNPLNSYNAMIRERVLENYQKCKFYQAIKYNNKKREENVPGFDIVKFFKVDFQGALFTKIIFNKNKIVSELESQKSNTVGHFKNNDKKIIESLIKTVKDDNFTMINTTLMVFEDYGNNVATMIEKYINCTLDLVKRDFKNLCNKTAIFSYNENFSRVIRKDFLYNYICSNSKLNSDKPDLVGLNIDKCFVNFGFKKATEKNSIPKAHTILLGTSGAGKTQAANDILKQLVGFDYENQKVKNIKNTNHVIFDIKDSFFNQVDAIKKSAPELVDMNTFDKTNFLYNIVDCEVYNRNGKKIVDEGDLTFSSTLVSLILASNDGNGLSSSESEEFKDVIRSLYVNDNYEKMSIVYIAETHAAEYNQLLEEGYNDFSLLSDLDDRFSKFKKPLLYNVINVLRERESNYTMEGRDLKKALVSSLIYKLETIEQIGIFSSYSKFDFKDKPIIYFNTDSLLESGSEEYGYMVFAMLSIIVKLVKRKQHAKRVGHKHRPMVYFWFEEARNIFSNKLFREKEVFERVINEWRSFDMVFFPITQEPQHIPDSILNGFEIKMMLVSGDDQEEKEDLISSLSKRLSIGDNRKKMLQTLPKYTMLVMYGDGAFTMKFKDDARFREMVNT